MTRRNNPEAIRLSRLANRATQRKHPTVDDRISDRVQNILFGTMAGRGVAFNRLRRAIDPDLLDDQDVYDRPAPFSPDLEEEGGRLYR